MLKPTSKNRIRSKNGILSVLAEFLNSHFGLWLLSTVFITFGTWVFSEWKHQREAQRSRAAIISRLDIEIANRFELAGLQTKTLEIPEPMGSADGERLAQAKDLLATVAGLPPPQDIIYYEYRRRSLRSLVTELREYVESPEERDCLTLALVELAWSSASGRFASGMELPSVSMQYHLLAAAAARRWGNPNAVNVPITAKNTSRQTFRICVGASPVPK